MNEIEYLTLEGPRLKSKRLDYESNLRGWSTWCWMSKQHWRYEMVEGTKTKNLGKLSLSFLFDGVNGPQDEEEKS